MSTRSKIVVVCRVEKPCHDEEQHSSAVIHHYWEIRLVIQCYPRRLIVLVPVQCVQLFRNVHGCFRFNRWISSCKDVAPSAQLHFSFVGDTSAILVLYHILCALRFDTGANFLNATLFIQK